MLRRDNIEKEYLPLYEKYGLGTTTFSPLASGILSGKYNNGIPEGSRLDQLVWLREIFQNEGGLLDEDTLDKVKRIGSIAEDLGATTAQLALAWCLKNPHVSSVITGASRVEQVHENMQAIAIKAKLSDEIMAAIEAILNNKPC